MTNFLRSRFNSSIATFICCTLAFINKCFIAWLYTDTSSDKALYLLFAKTIIHGHPPLEDTGLINGATNYFFNGAISSPLYSIVAIPFLWLTGSPFYTSLIIDVLAWLVFFTGLYRLGRILFKDTWIINLFIITAGFFLYPHELYSTPKDTISLGLICWACVLCSDIIFKPFQFLRAAIFFIVLAAIGLIKFFYVPVVFAFIAFICFYSITKKRKELFTQSIFIAFLLVVSGFLFHQYLTYLRNLYQEIVIVPLFEKNNRKGFYPEALLHVFPFISSSLINTTFWTVQFSKAFHQTFMEIGKWWRVIDCLLFLSLIIYVKNIWKRLYSSISWLICLLISLSIFLLLCYVSLTRQASAVDSFQQRFIFLAEPRFYLFIMLVIQMGCFFFIFKFPVNSFLKIFFLSLFFFETLHGIYFTVKQSLHYTSVQKELRMVNPVVNVFESVLKPATKFKKNILFISSNEDLRRLAQINNIEVLFFSPNLSMQAKESNGFIIVALAVKDSALFQKYSLLKEIKSDTINPFIIKTYR